MRVASLDTLEDVRSLSGVFEDYLTFVCADIERAFGLSFEPDGLIADTLAGLHKVIPPHGRTLVALAESGALLGMVFLRRSGPDAMEIKRLYVLPEARGTGAGRALVAAGLDAAREAGVGAVRLDTTRNLEAAIALYRAFGFEECEPYEESDLREVFALAPHAVYMEKRLG